MWKLLSFVEMPVSVTIFVQVDFVGALTLLDSDPEQNEKAPSNSQRLEKQETFAASSICPFTFRGGGVGCVATSAIFAHFSHTNRMHNIGSPKTAVPGLGCFAVMPPDLLFVLVCAACD